MSELILLAQSGSGGQIEQIAQTFGVDWSHLIAQSISFCIVAVLLYRFAYGPVLTMLEERRKRIAEGLAAAEKNKAQLSETEAQRQQVIAEATDQANRLIDEARNSAARIREQKVQEAAAEAEQIVAKARGGRPGARPHAGGLEAGTWSTGHRDHCGRQRQSVVVRRPATFGGGDRGTTERLTTRLN